MAFTYVNGNNIKANSYSFYFRSFVGYQVITNSADKYTLRLHAGVSTTAGGGVGWNDLQVTLASSITPSVGSATYTKTGNYRSANSMGSDHKVVYIPTLNSNTSYVDLTWNKTNSTQALKITSTLYKSSLASDTKSIATLNITIPAKTSYNITYNPNGGSGNAITDVKYYGANHTIRAASTFSRTNYNLTSWNTAANGTGTSYSFGATYSNNAALTLYAQWTLNYTSPTISGVSVFRSNASGTVDEAGTYITISSFTWGGGKVGSTQQKPYIKITINGTTKYGATQQSTTTGTFSKITYSGFGVDDSHQVVITIYDNNYTAYQTVKTFNIPTATYPIDLKINSKKVNMGIMTTAENGVPLKVPSLKSAGNITIGGTLQTTGAATFKNNLTVSGTFKLQNANLVDFVVEQGEGYRKWNSGVAECWIRTKVNVALNNAYGSLYQGTWNWNFPITFTIAPAVICSQFKHGTGASWGTVSGQYPTYAVLRGIDAFSRASEQCEITAYAVGTWK